MSSAERQLVRKLSRFTELSSLSMTVEVTGRRSWQSALFVGTCFTVACDVDDDGDLFEQWLADLPELDIQLRGHFVASAEVTDRRAGAAVIELLVIEEN